MATERGTNRALRRLQNLRKAVVTQKGRFTTYPEAQVAAGRLRRSTPVDTGETKRKTTARRNVDGMGNPGIRIGGAGPIINSSRKSPHKGYVQKSINSNGTRLAMRAERRRRLRQLTRQS